SARRAVGARALVRAQRDHAADHLITAIEPRRHAVHATDERTLAASDHSPTQQSHYLSTSVFSATELSPPAAKSSKAFSVTRMMCFLMNGAPSRAPSSGCLSAHSHSSTAQPSKS